MKITPSTVNPGFAEEPPVRPEPDCGFATACQHYLWPRSAWQFECNRIVGLAHLVWPFNNIHDWACKYCTVKVIITVSIGQEY